jgi:hypothetical protein
LIDDGFADLDQLACDTINRLRGIDLVGTGGTKQRLDLGQLTKDLIAFPDALPVIVRRPALDAAQKHVSRGAEQDHGLEAGVEPALVRHGAGDEEGRSVVPREKLADTVLTPGRSGSPDLLAISITSRSSRRSIVARLATCVGRFGIGRLTVRRMLTSREFSMKKVAVRPTPDTRERGS